MGMRLQRSRIGHSECSVEVGEYRQAGVGIAASRSECRMSFLFSLSTWRVIASYDTWACCEGQGTGSERFAASADIQAKVD